jgi:mutator protein MutT
MEQHLLADIPVKALIVRNGKILIAFDQKWELPGGRMNVGEQPEEALHREIREELGVEVRIFGIHDSWTFTSERTGQAHIVIVYRCELVDETPFHLDGNELTETRWISASDDLSTMPLFPGYLETFQKFFRNILV